MSLFWPGTSLWHRLDPRSKSLAGMAVFIVLLHTESWLLLLLGGAVVLLAARSSNIPWEGYRPGVLGFLPIIALSGIIQIWSLWTPEHTTYIAGLDFDSEAIKMGLLLGFKIAVIVLVAQIFALTTSPGALIEAAGSVFRPLRRIGLPVGELQMIMLIGYRFLPILLQENQTIREAQQCRGIDFQSGSPVRRLQLRLAIMIPLLNRALNSAEQLADSMEARGYVPGEERSRLEEIGFKSADILIICAGIVFVGLEFFLQ